VTGAAGGSRVVVHPGPAELAAGVAARLCTVVLDAQAERGTADVAITGGGMGGRLLRALATEPAREAVDWGAVDLWWADERFLPHGDPDRNETQAREAGLDVLPLDPDRVHPMPASDGPDGDSVEAAAARYAELLAAGAGDGQAVPRFDVLVLGVGPDAHCASLFPGHPALAEERLSVVGVHDSPKPPPTRISMTLPALRSAQRVWFLVAGTDKAGAVALARSGAPVEQAPSGAVSGRLETLWLLDPEAAIALA
jgi:6-phosphogluconolactonase